MNPYAKWLGLVTFAGILGLARAEEVPELFRWKELAANPQVFPQETRFEELSWGLRKTANRNIYTEAEADAIHVELRACLIKLGGCGDYYRDKINRAWDDLEMETEPGRPKESGPLKVEFTNCQREGFETLALLPAPSTVGVLGEFLFDDRGRLERLPSETESQRNERQYQSTINSSSTYALSAIAKLPIVDPPVPRRVGNAAFYDQDIEAWRTWFKEVKAGVRTFSFEGDPREYNLRGPANGVAPPSDKAK